MAVRAGVQLGVYVTSSMSSNSILARGYERSHWGCMTIPSVASSMCPKKLPQGHAASYEYD